MNKAVFIVSNLVLLLFITTSHANPILSISPENQTISTGTSVLFDVNISGLDSSSALGAFDINIGFDSNLLSFTHVAFGDPLLQNIDQLDPLNLGKSLPLATPYSGLVNLIDFSLYDPATLIAAQGNSFTLAVLSFTGLLSGSSPITLSINSLSNANAINIQAASQSGSVTIKDYLSQNAVPEPVALLLLMVSGLSFLLSQQRKRLI